MRWYILCRCVGCTGQSRINSLPRSSGGVPQRAGPGAPAEVQGRKTKPGAGSSVGANSFAMRWYILCRCVGCTGQSRINSLPQSLGAPQRAGPGTPAEVQAKDGAWRRLKCGSEFIRDAVVDPVQMRRVYRPIANEFAPTEFRGAARLRLSAPAEVQGRKMEPGAGSSVGANLFAMRWYILCRCVGCTGQSRINSLPQSSGVQQDCGLALPQRFRAKDGAWLGLKRGSEFIRDAVVHPVQMRRMYWLIANEFAPTEFRRAAKSGARRSPQGTSGGIMYWR